MDDAELLEARAELFGSVFVLAQHLTRLTDAALEPFDLTTRQWLLLAVLSSAFPDRDPSLSEAAERFGTSRQNVKQVALALQARGYLRVVPDPRDGRTTRLQRTERVRAFDEPAGQAAAAALLAEAHAPLTRDDVIALRRLVATWLAGFAPVQPIR